MSLPRKRFAEHSARWQREALREGLSPKRWDAWLRLSPKSRKVSDPRRYARGEPVRLQLRSDLEHAALESMKQAFAGGREATMRAGIRIMTFAELRWTIKAPPGKMRKRAGIMKVEATRIRNPWWYN